MCTENSSRLSEGLMSKSSDFWRLCKCLMSCLECPFFLSCDIHLPVRVKVHSLIGTVPVQCCEYFSAICSETAWREGIHVNCFVLMTMDVVSPAFTAHKYNKRLARQIYCSLLLLRVTNTRCSYDTTCKRLKSSTARWSTIRPLSLWNERKHTVWRPQSRLLSRVPAVHGRHAVRASNNDRVSKWTRAWWIVSFSAPWLPNR